MSPPSSKAAKKAAGPAPSPDVYVGLLFVAVAALSFGCALLAMELDKYEWMLPGR